MRVEDIEIFADGAIGRPYKTLGPIEARVTAGAAWNKARTVEDVNSKLREVALKMGANAVIDVTYTRGVSATSWKALTAYGTAVVAHSTERPCPYCAETIKRQATVCRFCGRDLPSVDEAEISAQDLDLIRQDHPNSYERATECLAALESPPQDEASWLRELCRRIDEGSPPEAAAARIPLDWP